MCTSDFRKNPKRTKGSFHNTEDIAKTMTWQALKCFHSSTTISTMYMTVHKHRVGPSAQLPIFIYQTSIGYEAQKRGYLAYFGLSPMCRHLHN